MFSSRLHWDLKPNAISHLLTQKRAAGHTILDLTESNPTRAGLPYPHDEITAAFDDPRILQYEPNPAGLRSTRESICRHWGENLDPDRLLLTASTSEGYMYLFKLLTEPGDEILVPRPSYPLFEFLAGMEMVKVIQYPLQYDAQWTIDFDRLEQAITPRTRALVLVNPNNPTGSYIHTHELPHITDVCRRHGLAIISDEVFSEFPLAAGATQVRSLRHVDSVLTFCMSGLSKLAAMPQMKLGWMHVNGPPQLRDEALARLELIADTYLSVSTPVQVAAPKLLEIGGGIRSAISQRTAANLRLLEHRARNSPLSVLAVEAGWYATVRVPRTRSEEDWVLHLLRDHDVLVQPGYFYDFESEAFLVLSLLTPEPIFAAGVEPILESA
ncbi:MAG: pyridoxal phosphate-dependent aminotransferase [Acidobacteriaceae bacterium]|nr:pyridoxal phosphate-dependent aminotransferase [Acidobacteriaceae bacterium]